VAAERHVIVAGAGIAGLTAALTLARAGLRATVLEQSGALQATGAGIQLSPNASRVLLTLGLRAQLAPFVTVPQAIRVMNGGSGREIARIPLGEEAERRYGAPYWTIHRADLQTALIAAVQSGHDTGLKLGIRVEDFAAHGKGVSVLGRRGQQMMVEERGIALLGADGLWSNIRARLRRQRPAAFAHRTAWRALVPSEAMPPALRAPVVHLWLGLDAHLVHYPVRGGRLINIVGIVHDEWNGPGWSAAGDRAEILRHFARFTWCEAARGVVALPERWLKWALHERRAPFRGGEGPVTLIGDAAHPMLPFLAQGAAMAIEDAAVVADRLARGIDDPTRALRTYEAARTQRTTRAQRMARKQGRVYGLTGPEALVRNIGMKLLGSEKLLARQDWLYSWKPPQPFQIESVLT
jgi:salicylate hydroxylase